MRSLPEPARHVLILVARITVSVIMLAHVWQSFFQQGFGTATDQFTNFGIPLAIVATAFTLVVELIGSILILLGIFVPYACAGMAFVMYGAIYFVHGAHGVFVKNNGWELVALIAGLCLAIAAFGPGRYSLDHLVFDRRKAPEAPAPIDVRSDPAGVAVAPAPAAFRAAGTDPATPSAWDAQPRWDAEPAQATQWDEPAAPAPRWAQERQPVSLWGDSTPQERPTRVPSAYSGAYSGAAPRSYAAEQAPVWTEPQARPSYADYADPRGAHEDGHDADADPHTQTTISAIGRQEQ